MDTQQPIQPDRSTNGDPKSFQLYTGKAPWPLQLVGGLMWLGGIGMIFTGIPLLLAFGLGIMPIVLGVLSIKYARAVFKMQKKGYKGAMVIYVIGLVLSIVKVVADGGGEKLFINAIQIIATILILLLLYSYRDKFVDGASQT